MPASSVLTILRAIKHHAPISRTDLQRLTGLSWGTVTNTTRQLLNLKLIKEQNAPSPKSGRKPTLLSLDPEGPCLVGIDIAPAAIRCLVASLDGNILFEQLRPLAGPSAKALAHAADLVQCAQAAAQPRTLLGVGISLPHNPAATNGNPQPWADDTLRDILQSQFRLPVSLQHHAAALALAQRWFGNLPEDDFLLLDLNHSVSLAAIVHGDLCPPGPTPPNFAHFSLDPQGPSCPCGNRGCVDTYCSIPALLSFAHHSANGEACRVESIEQLTALASAGNIPARTALDRLAHYLALALSNLIQLFHPARIVLTGPTLIAADFFLPTLTAHLTLPNPLVAPRQNPDLNTPILSQLGPRAPALGAAATLLQSALTPNPVP